MRRCDDTTLYPVLILGKNVLTTSTYWDIAAALPPVWNLPCVLSLQCWLCGNNHGLESLRGHMRCNVVITNLWSIEKVGFMGL